MGKTYLETIKYLIVADFEVQGLVERPDVIGAIFGQSEGLLGSQLDIKELQQNGKIGRIEITVNHSNNKTTGTLKLPCSLSMVETAIIGAAIETIDKVGPCDTFFIIKQIEDTRGLKRKQIKERAIELLGKVMQEEIPDTKELMDEIQESFKTKDIILYGPDKLPAGPTIGSSKEVIVVEGRADVINMLRYGFTNVISTGGARIPRSLSDICKGKIVTLFLDGDHGGEIQQSQLLKYMKVDFVSRAPDSKEVEELTQKEINQALRRKIKAGYIDSNKQRSSSSSVIPEATPISVDEPSQVTTSIPNLVKQTKFSATNEHKIMKPLQFGQRREEPLNNYQPHYENRDDKPRYENRDDKPRYENRDDKPRYENRDDKPRYENRDDKPRYEHRDNVPSTHYEHTDSRPRDDFKKSEFDSMLSSIPNVERVDVSASPRGGFGGRDNRSGGGNFNRDRNGSGNRDSFRRDNNSQRRDNSFQRRDDFHKTDDSRKPFNNISKPNLTEDIVSIPKEPVDIIYPQTNFGEKKETNIDFKKITDFAPVEVDAYTTKTKVSEPIVSQVQASVQEKEIIKEKEIKPKKVEPKKQVILPKLTDKIKASLLEIVNEGENKGQSRILNEKFRRIGASKNEDLLSKLEGFKPYKIYAIVTDMPLSTKLIEVSKEKGVMFLVSPETTVKDDKEINIVTFDELK